MAEEIAARSQQTAMPFFVGYSVEWADGKDEDYGLVTIQRVPSDCDSRKREPGPFFMINVRSLACSVQDGFEGPFAFRVVPEGEWSNLLGGDWLKELSPPRAILEVGLSGLPGEFVALQPGHQAGSLFAIYPERVLAIIPTSGLFLVAQESRGFRLDSPDHPRVWPLESIH